MVNSISWSRSNGMEGFMSSPSNQIISVTTRYGLNWLRHSCDTSDEQMKLTEVVDFKKIRTEGGKNSTVY